MTLYKALDIPKKAVFDAFLEEKKEQKTAFLCHEFNYLDFLDFLDVKEWMWDSVSASLYFYYFVSVWFLSKNEHFLLRSEPDGRMFVEHSTGWSKHKIICVGIVLFTTSNLFYSAVYG